MLALVALGAERSEVSEIGGAAVDDPHDVVDGDGAGIAARLDAFDARHDTEADRADKR